MGEHFAVAIEGGNLRQLLLDRFDNAVGPAIAAAVDSAAVGLQDELRAQVAAAGLGAGLTKAWQHIPPGKKGYRFAALVYSKARRLHLAFNASFIITAQAGRWLVIPLPAAIAAGWSVRGQRRGGGGTGGIPAKWSDVAGAASALGRLRFVALDGGRALLFPPGKKGAARGEALFLLVRQTSHSAVLDIQGAARRATLALRAALDALAG